MLASPRTDPCERSYRTRLLPRVLGVESRVWERVHGLGSGIQRSTCGRKRCHVIRCRCPRLRSARSQLRVNRARRSRRAASRTTVAVFCRRLGVGTVTSRGLIGRPGETRHVRPPAALPHSPHLVWTAPSSMPAIERGFRRRNIGLRVVGDSARPPRLDSFPSGLESPPGRGYSTSGRAVSFRRIPALSRDRPLARVVFDA